MVPLLPPAVVALLIYCPAFSVIDLSGPVYDGNGGPLLSGNVYRVIADIEVPAGQTLSVEKDVVVKFDGAYELRVLGTLDVDGADAQEAYFTSIHDDSVGGDTNGNGGATTPAPGDWKRILVGDFVQASHLDLEHTVLRYGGFGGEAMVGAGARESLRLVKCTLEKGEDEALHLGASRKSVTIEGCAFNDNGGLPITRAVLPNLPGIRDCTASGNTIGDYIRIATGSDENIAPGIVVGPENTLGSVLVFGKGNLLLTFASDVTFLPGLVCKMGPGAQRIEAGGGALRIKGLPERPVVFTSLYDDGVLGDTNKDGSATSSAPGDFGGIGWNGPSRGSAENVVVRYGGLGDRAQVESFSDGVTLRSIRAEFGSSHGFHVTRHLSPAFNWVAHANGGNGFELANGAIAFVLRNSTSHSNSGAGMRRFGNDFVTVIDCISWNNSGGNFASFTGAEVRYSDGGFSGSNGNIDVDPMFVNPGTGDLRLQAGSPCVDRGIPNEKPGGADALSFSRILDGDLDLDLRTDMGAHEYAAAELDVTDTAGPGDTITIATTGTPSTSAILFASLSSNDIFVANYGNLLVSVLLFTPWPNVPGTIPAPLPSNLPTPLDLYLQLLASYPAGAGTLTNFEIVQVR